MKTEFIPFDITRMHEAISFKTVSGREVSHLVKINEGGYEKLYAYIDGEMKRYPYDGRFACKVKQEQSILMEVEKQLNYPLLCWVSITSKYPDSNCSYDLIANKKGSATHPYKGARGKWVYATPMSEVDLAKMGLMQITEEKLQHLQDKGKFTQITDYSY